MVINEDLRELMKQKRLQLIPENIKDGTNVLGVTGNFTGSIARYNTIDEMNADKTKQLGTMGIVYSKEKVSVNGNTSFSKMTFPKKLKIPVTIAQSADSLTKYYTTPSGYRWQVSFSNSLNYGYAYIQMYNTTNYNYVVQYDNYPSYETIDDVSYYVFERSDTNAETYDFGELLTPENDSWTTFFDYLFDQTNYEFNGLFNYTEFKDNDAIGAFPLDNCYITTNNDDMMHGTTYAMNTTGDMTKICEMNELEEMLEKIGEEFSWAQSNGLDQTHFTLILVNNVPHLIFSTYDTGVTEATYWNINIGINLGENNRGKYALNSQLFVYTNDSTDDITPNIYDFTLDLEAKTYTYIKYENLILTKADENNQSNYVKYNNLNIYTDCLPISCSTERYSVRMNATFANSLLIPDNSTSSGYNYYSITYDENSAIYSGTRWEFAPNQLNVGVDDVLEGLFFGSDGVAEGTLLQRDGLTMDQVIHRANVLLALEKPKAPQNISDYYLYSNHLGNTQSLDFGHPEIDFSDTTNAARLFSSCGNLLEVNALNFQNSLDASSMFAHCTNLSALPNLNLVNVVNASEMFTACNNLNYEEVLPNVCTDHAIDMSHCFDSTPTTYSIRNMLNYQSAEHMASYFNNCQDITDLTLTLPNLKSAESMFYGCKNLTNVDAHFSNCENAFYMFNGTNISDINTI